MNEDIRHLALKRLKHQLQALAMPAQVQLRLLPAFVCKADELALDYDNWCQCVLRNDADTITEQQRLTLTTLDNYLDNMSGEANAHLWTDEALQVRPEWAVVRSMAVEALSSFGWPVQEPEEPI